MYLLLSPIECLTTFLAPCKELVERVSLSLLIPTALRAGATMWIASLGVAFVHLNFL